MKEHIAGTGRKSREHGQGIVGLAIILGLVSLVTIGTVIMLGSAITGELERLVNRAPTGPPVIARFAAIPTDTPTPTETRTPTAAFTTVAASGTVAEEDFESGDATGGSGWSSPWSLSDAVVTGDAMPYAGAYHLRVQESGSASRIFDLSGYDSAAVEFRWKGDGLESGDRFELQIDDGSGWATAYTMTAADGYQFTCVSLSSYSLGSGFAIRFKGFADHRFDRLYIDELVIEGN